MKGDFERYLSAKATVDDRALDRPVLDRFRRDLCSRRAPRILEAGTGTGAFLTRLLSWDDLPDCTYVAVDTDADLLATARDRLLERARDHGFSASVVDPRVTDVERASGTIVAAIRLSGPARVDVRLVAGDAVSVSAAGEWDVLVAQAFVDLLSLEDVTRLCSGVADGGSVYFPITFDGGTTFVPSHPLDDELLAAYHATMTEGGSLGATAGRQLLTVLPDLGITLDAVGGSDWVVPPSHPEPYPADESYFLSVLVETVADAVSETVPSRTRTQWLTARQRERKANRLGFVARNLDLFGTVDRSTES